MGFIRKTVLILGAGAHVEYGMPTARELTDEIVSCNWPPRKGNNYMDDDACEMERIGTRVLGENWARYTTYHDFTQNLGISGTLSIDQYAESVPRCRRIASTLISAYLHYWEAFAVAEANYDGLYKWLFQRAWPDGGYYRHRKPPDYGNLDVITFNYDRVLEFLLHHMGVSNEAPGAGHDGLRLTCSPRVLHVYGTLTGGYVKMHNLQRHRPVVNLETIRRSAAAILLAEQRSESEVETHRLHLAQIRQVVANAESIVFLGFAFDRSNLAALGFGHGHKLYASRIYASSYGLSENQKNAAKSFIGREIVFHDGKVMDCLDRWLLE